MGAYIITLHGSADPYDAVHLRIAATRAIALRRYRLILGWHRRRLPYRPVDVVVADNGAARRGHPRARVRVHDLVDGDTRLEHEVRVVLVEPYRAGQVLLDGEGRIARRYPLRAE